MDRRDFFSRCLGRAAEQLVQHADKKIGERAARWIRPPFAIPELEFLLACTRCNACIDACPQGIIFPLAAKNGADVMNTPALDLLNKGCKLCMDWPCVTACEATALHIPEHSSDPPRVTLAWVTINVDSCLPYLGPECGACATSCPVEGALVWQMERPSINSEKCSGCALCREACVTQPKSISIQKVESCSQHPAITNEK